MNPQYSDSYLDKYYSSYIDHTATQNDEPAFAIHSFYLKKIRRFVGKSGKLLDYGCGSGRFMNVALKNGWNVYGYDVDCNSTAKVSFRLGVKVWCGKIDDINWGNESFDLVNMHHVFEHVKDPLKTINNLGKILNKNGHFLIAVPNIRSLSSTIKTYLERKGIRKRRIGAHYATDHHLFYYCPETLQFLLKKCGFEIIYKRNGYKADIGQSKLKRFLLRNIVEYLYPNSQFVVLARKVKL